MQHFLHSNVPSRLYEWNLAIDLEYFKHACLQAQQYHQVGETKMGKCHWNCLSFTHKFHGNRSKHTKVNIEKQENIKKKQHTDDLWRTCFCMNVDVNIVIVVSVSLSLSKQSLLLLLWCLMPEYGRHPPPIYRRHTCTKKHTYTHYEHNMRGEN